jgi:predicted dinucleotide-binding enzyme
MKIAIIGSGNVGGALAKKWSKKGHSITFGVRDQNNFKGKELIQVENISFASIQDAVKDAEVIVLATPAMSAIEVTQSLGNTENKIIIDTMNIVMGRGPIGFSNTSDAILANTQTNDVVKCFNSTGFNNIQDTNIQDQTLDMFVAGDSKLGTEIAVKLSIDAGFSNCYSIGGNDKFELLEKFAFFWINLAMFQGLGREIGFKLLKR